MTNLGFSFYLALDSFCIFPTSKSARLLPLSNPVSLLAPSGSESFLSNSISSHELIIDTDYGFGNLPIVLWVRRAFTLVVALSPTCSDPTVISTFHRFWSCPNLVCTEHPCLVKHSLMHHFLQVGERWIGASWLVCALCVPIAGACMLFFGM